MKQRLVVIGNGMAGLRTVEELLQSAPDLYDITIFGAEPYGNYNRIMLSQVLCGEKSVNDIVINDSEWYRDNGITLHAGTGKTVTRIERGKSKVIAQDGTCADYDRLLIATGSKPMVPDVPGKHLAGVIGFREIADVNTMLSYCQSHSKAVVLGGGLLGLEAAHGLLQQGMDVTVIHSRDALLNKQLDRYAGKMLQGEFERRGVKFKMNAQTDALIGDEQAHVKAVRFTDGSELECDLLVLAVGVQPNIALAKQAGLYCERGIVVNDTLQTYDPCVYAVGECIQHRGGTFGLVAPLFEQAKVCANHLSRHGVAEFINLPTSTKLKVSGINVFSVGDILGDKNGETIKFSDPSIGTYKKLVLDGNTIKGCVLYGDTADGNWYQSLLEQKTDISGIREQLIFGRNFCGESAQSN